MTKFFLKKKKRKKKKYILITMNQWTMQFYLTRIIKEKPSEAKSNKTEIPRNII